MANKERTSHSGYVITIMGDGESIGINLMNEDSDPDYYEPFHGESPEVKKEQVEFNDLIKKITKVDRRSQFYQSKEGSLKIRSKHFGRPHNDVISDWRREELHKEYLLLKERIDTIGTVVKTKSPFGTSHDCFFRIPTHLVEEWNKLNEEAPIIAIVPSIQGAHTASEGNRFIPSNYKELVWESEKIRDLSAPYRFVSRDYYGGNVYSQEELDRYIARHRVFVNAEAFVLDSSWYLLEQAINKYRQREPGIPLHISDLRIQVTSYKR